MFFIIHRTHSFEFQALTCVNKSQAEYFFLPYFYEVSGRYLFLEHIFL